MAHWLSEHGKEMWLRHVLVPRLTDSDAELYALKNLADELETVKKIEILPYHTLGISKWERLGLEYPLKGVRVPTEEEVEYANSICRKDLYIG